VVLALEASGVSYRRCGRTLVQRVSLCVERGEFLAVVGDAGSGAGTLVRLLAGDLAPDQGRVLVDGRTGPSHPARDPADPRRVAAGIDAMRSTVADAPPHSILVFELAGSVGASGAAHDANCPAVICRRAADDGHAVVAAVDDPREIALHAHTVAVLVAGRLVHWATPAIAFSPALRLFERSVVMLDHARSIV